MQATSPQAILETLRAWESVAALTTWEVIKLRGGIDHAEAIRSGLATLRASGKITKSASGWRLA